MAVVNQRKNGPASYLLTRTLYCTCLLLSLSIQNGCFMLILPPTLVPSLAKIPYFWEFFHQKRGFRKNMSLWYQVFQQLFTQGLLYWLWASRVLQFLLYTGTRRCNFLFRWFGSEFINNYGCYYPPSPFSHVFHVRGSGFRVVFYEHDDLSLWKLEQFMTHLANICLR